jgi:hypothetical protein
MVATPSPPPQSAKWKGKQRAEPQIEQKRDGSGDGKVIPLKYVGTVDYDAYVEFFEFSFFSCDFSPFLLCFLILLPFRVALPCVSSRYSAFALISSRLFSSHITHLPHTLPFSSSSPPRHSVLSLILTLSPPPPQRLRPPPLHRLILLPAHLQPPTRHRLLRPLGPFLPMHILLLPGLLLFKILRPLVVVLLAEHECALQHDLRERAGGRDRLPRHRDNSRRRR